MKFYGGALFVEFFFFLSGFFGIKYIQKLVTQDIQTGLENEIWKYMKNKYCKLFPYLLEGVCLYYISYWLSNGINFRNALASSVFIPLETFLLGLTGTVQVKAGTYWYLSGLFIVLPAVLWLSVKIKKIFFYYIVIFFPWILHGYLFYKYGTIRVSTSSFDIFFRIIGDLFFAGLIYLLTELFQKYHLKRTAKTILTGAQFVTILAAVFLTTSKAAAKSRYEEIFIILICISLIIALSNQTFLANWNSRTMTFLAKLSLPIYLFHWPMFTFLEVAVFKDGYISDIQIISGLVITLFVSLIFIQVNEEMLPRMIFKLKNIQIKRKEV